MTAVIKILKIIGIAILWILAAVLILALVFLICPVYYEINGEKYDKIKAYAKIKLLFGLFSIRLGYDDGDIDSQIKIFGRLLNRKNNDEAFEPENMETDEKEGETQASQSEKCADKEPAVKKTESTKAKEPIPQRKTEIKTASRAEGWDSTEAAEREPEVRKIKFADVKQPEEVNHSEVEVKRIKLSETDDEPKEEKPEEKESERLDFNYFKNMPKEERKQLFSAIIKLMKSILKGVKPRDFYLEGTVGFSDPSLTGQAVGAAWALNGILNKKIEIRASFEKEIVEGETGIKGHIVPGFMLFYILRFIAVKPVRKIIKLLIKGDKNGK